MQGEVTHGTPARTAAVPDRNRTGAGHVRPRMTLTPARILLPALLMAALALTGCSGGADDGGSTADSSVAGEAPPADREAAVTSDLDAAVELADGVEGYDSASKPEAEDAPDTAEQALIRKGNVVLRADDVGRAQIEVQKVVDTYAGQVTDERTSSDDDGKPTYARMVLRIPSDDFGKAVTALKKVGEVESIKTNQDDVTTEVIDVQTRLRVQQRSIARITVLFERAQSIRDIMAIESELSQRQAELESLQQQAAYLENQTSLSTIVVSIDQTPVKHTEPKDEDDAGFLAGLSAGWGALSAFAVGLATAAGALLPWLVVAAVVGIPTALLVRALRRRTAVAAVETPQSSE